MLPTREHAAKEKRSIDGRDFALPFSLARVHVDEVVEEAVLVWQVVPHKAERLLNAFYDFTGLAIAAPIGDA
jgi:hypothetical protein